MGEKTKAKRRRIYIIYLLLTVLIILSIIYIVNFFITKREAKEQSNMLSALKIDEIEVTKEIVQNNLEDNEENDKTEEIEKGLIEEDLEEQKQKIERMLQVKQLKEQNADVVGWLEIKNTNISYPVLQGKDNSYYMTHNYKNEKSKNDFPKYYFYYTSCR